MFPQMTNNQMMPNPILDLWMKSLQGFSPTLNPFGGNICSPFQATQPVNPMAQMQQAMQQNMKMWQNMMATNPFAPQAVPQPAPSAFPSPKITVVTIELGDMKPYMEAASQMMQMWQPQMAQMFSPMVRK